MCNRLHPYVPGAVLLAAGICLIAALSFDPVTAAAAEPDRTNLVAAAIASQIKPVRERIAGTWLLMSFYDEDERGEEIERWGPDPKGRLSFDDQGRFAFQLQDNLGFHLCVAYSGTYKIAAEARIKLRPDTWAVPGEDEIDHVADIVLKDGMLDLTSSVRPSLAGSTYSHTRWQRLSEPPDTHANPCAR